MYEGTTDRQWLEFWARGAEEDLTVEETRGTYSQGLRHAYRAALVKIAPSFIGVHLEGADLKLPGGLVPVELQATVGSEAYHAFARFHGQPISTSFTFEWDGVLNPDAILGAFGIEEGDTLKVVPVPNRDFESRSVLPVREPTAV